MMMGRGMKMRIDYEKTRSILENLVADIQSGAFVSGKYKRLCSSVNDVLSWYYELGDNPLEIIVESKSPSGCRNSMNTASIRVWETMSVDQKWYMLHFKLLDMKDTQIFITMILDLISYTETYESSGRAISKVVERFMLWKSMMRHRGEDRSRVRGVIGELWTIKRLLEVARDGLSVINSWTGPEYSRQDFMMEDIWVESKMVTSNASLVRISSLGQLDNDDRPGYLFVTMADDCEPTADGAVSVRSLVDEIKTMLDGNPQACTAFSNKLNEYDYACYTLMQDSYSCIVLGERLYKVEGKFPRLFNSAQMPGIRTVKYELELSSLEPWRVEDGYRKWRQN